MTRCEDRGPEPEPETCLLELGHEGWHKSNHHGWPNAAESLEKWAAIGRRLLREPIPGLSKRELEYALDALEKTSTRSG